MPRSVKVELLEVGKDGLEEVGLAGLVFEPGREVDGVDVFGSVKVVDEEPEE